MKIKSFIFSVISLFASISFVSCDREDLPKAVEEGLPLGNISFSVNVPEEKVAITKASDVQETTITNLALLFMKKTGDGTSDGAIVMFFEDLGTKTEVSSTDYIYGITITAEQFADAGITSGEYYIYGIGNYGKGYINYSKDQIYALQGMTKSEIDEELVTKTNKEIDFHEMGVLMTGIYGTADGVASLPGSAEGTDTVTLPERVHLRRFVSKINVIIDKDPELVNSFVVNSIEVHNYSPVATLFERRGWNNTQPGAGMDYLGNESQMRSFTTTMDRQDDGSYSMFFYMPENVQRASSTLSSYADRERHVSSTDQSFSLAPQNATYFVIRGRYNDDNYSGTVTYYVHLGDFSNGNVVKEQSGTGSYDNFTVRRNYKYNYHITVKGVNNIKVEAESGGTGFPVEVQPGAEGNIVGKNEFSFIIDLDSHYENVLLKMKVPDSKTVTAYTIQANTPFSDDALNSITYDAINQSSQENDYSATKGHLDYQWVHFAQPSSSNGLAKYKSTGDGTVADVFTLLEELRDAGNLSTYVPKSSDHFKIVGDFIYTIAYVDEFYYQDKMDAAANNDAKTELLEKIINVSPRTLTVSFGGAKKSDDQKSTYIANILFSFRQRSIVSAQNLALPNPMGLETIEETPVSTAYAVITSGNDNSDSFGWNNFKTAVVGKTWTTLLDDSKNGYDQVYTDPTGMITAMKGNDAAYPCLSRNRIENGGSTIGEEDVKWYLPSHVEELLFWYGNNGLPYEARLSVNEEGKARNYASSTFDQKTWWANEGTAFGQKLPGTVQLHSRCARALKSYNESISPVSKVLEGNTVTVFGVTGDGVRESGTQLTEYVEHNRNSGADKLPDAFKVAAANLSVPAKTVTCNVVAPEIEASVSNKSTLTIKVTNISELSSEYKIKIGNTVQDELLGEYTMTVNSTNTLSVYSVRTFEGVSFDSNPSTIGLSKSGSTYSVNSTSNGLTADITKEISPAKSTFTFDEVTSGDVCERNYSEEADQSDLGFWRIPNEKELSLMLLHFPLDYYTCARSTYTRSSGKNVFYVQNANPKFITTDTDHVNSSSTNCIIRCVRDAVSAANDMNPEDWR